MQLPKNTSDAGGQIITFYSYKGGTGRSMALANTAWILASNGKRVLMIDWDLEAPGLHQYFSPFLGDNDLTSCSGVIDFVIDYATEAMTPTDNSDHKLPKDWYRPYANILRYAFSLDWSFRNGGTLDFVPAGKQDSSYATKVNGFDWQNFYDRLGGGAFLEASKERMRAEYDYILIDSRTGLSDTSGICTVQMPDILVVCFTLNNQSIEGASAVTRAVYNQRLGESGIPGIKIFPVPSRVEKAEKLRLEIAREMAQARFDPFLWHIPSQKRESYWGEVEVLYEPYYAYEEVLATFRDKPGLTVSLLASVERLTTYLTDGQVERLVPLSASERQRVLTTYSRKPVDKHSTGDKEYLFFFSYSRRDRDDLIERFFFDLCEEVRQLTGTESEVGFFDSRSLIAGEEWANTIEHALRNSKVLVVLISPNYLNSEFTEEFERFREREPLAHRRNPILPVLWIPPLKDLPPSLREATSSAWDIGDHEHTVSSYVSHDYTKRGLWFLDVYKKEGLRFLLRSKHRFLDEYHFLLRGLAIWLGKYAQDTRLPKSPIRKSGMKMRTAAMKKKK